MSFTINKNWPADFGALTEEIPEAGILHDGINAIIDPNFVLEVTCTQTATGPTAGTCKIVTDAEPSAGEKTAIDALLAAHTGVFSGGTSEDTVYTVPITVQVGDFVRITSGGTSADRADNTAQATIPAAAIVVSKPSSTTALLASEGDIDGLSGMNPGEDQFLGTAGARIEKGSLPSAPGTVIQLLGVAVTATVIRLGIRQVIVL